jgi:putative Holliday junction resolvase
MRYLCIDLGDKRTGLAVGDAITRIATPLDVLEVPIDQREGGALLDALVATVNAQFSPHAQYEIVLGLPLNMADSSEGPRAKIVRAFADKLSARLTPKRTIHFHDERLSSANADWQMSQSGLTHKQKKLRRDALAAAAILTDFFKAHLPPASSGSEDGADPHG